MHKSQLKTHLTLISHVNKEYELSAGTIRTHMNIGSLIIKLWNWLNILLYRFNYTLVSYVYYNETSSAQVCDLLFIASKRPMNWCLYSNKVVLSPIKITSQIHEL